MAAINIWGKHTGKTEKIDKEGHQWVNQHLKPTKDKQQ